MKCSNCGKEVNKGSFCPECGSSLSTGKMIELYVKRKKKIMGCAIPFPVYVDDVKIGDLKNGTTLKCEVCEGKHRVVLKCVEKEVVQEIDVTPTTSSVEVICHATIGLVAAVAKLDGVNYN